MQDILAQLPHRHPFLMVDRILEREPGVRVRARKLVSAGDTQLQGHFPDFPVMPGVLLLEMLAQTSAFLEEVPLAGPAFLAQIVDARFKSPARPGDCLELEVRPDGGFGGLRRVKGQVSCDGRVVCTATLTVNRGAP